MIHSKNLAHYIVAQVLQGKSFDVVMKEVETYLTHYHRSALMIRVMHYVHIFLKKYMDYHTLKIMSPYELSTKDIHALEKAFSLESQNTLVTINPNLIGGFIASYQGTLYDASIRSRLQQLNNHLTLK